MTLPHIFQLQTFCQCPFWVSHGCVGTASWGGTCCLEVIPTYWKPSPHLYFGQLSIPSSSEPSFLACNSQAPHCWWVPHTGVTEGPTASWQVQQWCSFSSSVFQQWCESKEWLCLLKHQLFLLSGRKEWDQSFHISTFFNLVFFCPKSVRVCGLPGNESANLGAGNRLTWF